MAVYLGTTKMLTAIHRRNNGIYFLLAELDDGAYNPLWTTKGFTQTFHFWKESRRAQSVPLNAYLTYVTLPWFTIITGQFMYVLCVYFLCV